jgi:hypothetical protein
VDVFRWNDRFFAEAMIINAGNFPLKMNRDSSRGLQFQSTLTCPPPSKTRVSNINAGILFGGQVILLISMGQC